MRACGVAVVPADAREGGVRVSVRAPIVVAAAGALHTPALLLRSGLDGGGRVGANLRLHPCTVVIGTFSKAWGSLTCALIVRCACACTDTFSCSVHAPVVAG